MSVTIKTQLRATQFDALRESQGTIGNLTLYRATATGYALLETITEGWFSEREAHRNQDELQGAQFYVVRIAETKKNLRLITAAIAKQVVAVGVMSRRFKASAKIEPMGDPRFWQFQCDPTGEAIT